MSLTHALRDALLPLGARLTRRGRGAADTLLIVQPDHLGDVLLAQPAVRRLRAAFPERRLVAVVGPWSARSASEPVTTTRNPSRWRPTSTPRQRCAGQSFTSAPAPGCITT